MTLPVLLVEEEVALVLAGPGGGPGKGAGALSCDPYNELRSIFSALASTREVTALWLEIDISEHENDIYTTGKHYDAILCVCPHK